MTESRPAPGTQTLARGLRALQYVAIAPEGVAIHQVADHLGVHRSIASRLLTTLADHKLIVRGADQRYRVGSGLAALASGIHSTLRVAAEPVLRDVAEQLGATITLLVAEGDEAVALSVVSPAQSNFHLTFHIGGRHPLDRAAGGAALLAAEKPRPREALRVTEARSRGYAESFGEVEPGAYGVAVPLPRVPGVPAACLNVITHRPEIAARTAPILIAAAQRLAASLG